MNLFCLGRKVVAAVLQSPQLLPAQAMSKTL